jgi:hypothetical protein
MPDETAITKLMPTGSGHAQPGGNAPFFSDFRRSARAERVEAAGEK